MGYPADAIVAATHEPVLLTASAARRIREALARSEFVLRQIEFAKASRLSGAAREARSEIGAAVAHLDRALPPTHAAVIAGVTAEGHEPTASARPEAHAEDCAPCRSAVQAREAPQ